MECYFLLKLAYYYKKYTILENLMAMAQAENMEIIKMSRFEI